MMMTIKLKAIIFLSKKNLDKHFSIVCITKIPKNEYIHVLSKKMSFILFLRNVTTSLKL